MDTATLFSAKYPLAAWAVSKRGFCSMSETSISIPYFPAILRRTLRTETDFRPFLDSWACALKAIYLELSTCATRNRGPWGIGHAPNNIQFGFVRSSDRQCSYEIQFLVDYKKMHMDQYKDRNFWGYAKLVILVVTLVFITELFSTYIDCWYYHKSYFTTKTGHYLSMYDEMSFEFVEQTFSFYYRKFTVILVSRRSIPSSKFSLLI